MKQQNPILYVWIALAIGALVGMYWEVGGYFAERWLARSGYYHCLAVPFIVGWLVWRHVSDERREIAPTYRWLPLLCFGVIVYLLGMRTGARFITGFSIPIVIVGIAGSLLGSAYLRVLWLPLALSAFMVPIPEHILGLIAMPMQMFSTAATGIITHLMGFALAWEGVTLNLHGMRFIVAQECSGLNSLMALFLVGAVLAEISALSTGRKLAVLVLIFPIVVVANIIRLVTVIWMAEFVGAQFALGTLVHGGSDVIVYLCAFMFVWLLISALSPPEETDEPSDGGEAGEEDWESGLRSSTAEV